MVVVRTYVLHKYAQQPCGMCSMCSTPFGYYTVLCTICLGALHPGQILQGVSASCSIPRVYLLGCPGFVTQINLIGPILGPGRVLSSTPPKLLVLHTTAVFAAGKF